MIRSISIRHIKLLIILLFFTSLPPLFYNTSSIHAANNLTAQTEQIESFLKQQSTIRILINQAPGMGHQSHTLLCMKRLRQLGFAGHFEVIYEGAKSKQQLDKLEVLFPGFNGIDTDKRVEIPHHNTSLQSRDYFNKRAKVEVLPLALTGGIDGKLYNGLHTTHFIALNPQSWITKDAYYNEFLKKKELVHLHHLGALNLIPEVTNWEQFVRQHLSKETFQEKGKPLYELFQAMESSESMTWYGVDRSTFDQAGRERTTEALIKLIKENPGSLKGGIIVPIVAQLSTSQVGYMKKFIADSPEVKQRVKWMALADAQLSTQLGSIKSGEILMVNVGAVPQDIFFQLFRLSSLPPTTSGKGSKLLAETLGKPYISAYPLEREMDREQYLYEKKDPSLARTHEVSELFTRPRSTAQQVDFIYQYLLDAKDPLSELSKFYGTLRQQRINLEYDLVFRALNELLPIIKKGSALPKKGPVNCQPLWAQGQVFNLPI